MLRASACRLRKQKNAWRRIWVMSHENDEIRMTKLDGMTNERRVSGACSKRRLAGEKIGATGFEPATCRRGDRVRFCNKALFVPLHDGLRNFRCESGSRERRAWLLSSDRYCDD